MKIITNEDLIWKTDNYDVILVGTSIYCMLTNGFQSKMRMKYPYIDKKNDTTGYGDFRKMGTRLTIEFDGNGDKDKILRIMEDCTKGMDLDVYDYVQLDRMKEIKLQKEKITRLKDADYEKYQKMWSMKDDMFKKMYLAEK